MKRILYFAFLMIITVTVLPLLIVKGCSFGTDGVQQGPNTQNMIKVYINSDNQVKEMPLDEYIKGVVAAEMPAEFELEALKAQAVAARTYAYGRMKKIYTAKEDVHSGADICTDPAHCQAWTGKDRVMKKWGFFSALKYWNKISKAVDETKDVVITYNQNIINPVFHSNSGGKTENAEDVWEGGSVPYLRSVVSNGEDISAEFKTTVSINNADFLDKLKNGYPGIKVSEKDVFKDIKILSFTGSGRIKTIKIGNISMKGTDFRKMLSLRSTNFTLEKGEDGSLRITTLGNGHGVGMSQWGANYLAKNGGSYEEILKYYYTGVELDKLENYK